MQGKCPAVYTISQTLLIEFPFDLGATTDRVQILLALCQGPFWQALGHYEMMGVKLRLACVPGKCTSHWTVNH